MIESVSHITFVVKDLDRTTSLFVELFDAKEVYHSGDEQFSLSRERFFIIGGQWIAVMEDETILNKTYHHIAFKIAETDFDYYLNKIQHLNLDLKEPRKRISGEGSSIYFYDYDHNLFELHTGTLQDRLDTYKKSSPS
ncbi:FosX/FosE/FosI family fosfomycin resistance hydrolase [Alkalicoccobacillus murimartini]|uniref:Catechol 2,3-dioxygenase-like lactoylglutathione lyase family enzyme n=1 Tax=Alkalicoccobacillus murimartini TaxID=171685 RepID=A0ABT9YLE3_9BACI|nr:FosX/FosE/FosI family fosfomycin resistance hydrolase [Alkalicoccobacillus murimartini]MDQ0208699.1 catechol 2,3-dioxygenase-like lactoylglutathione lyase family enzyme [Alkalicoccobacillus murimartini]